MKHLATFGAFAILCAVADSCSPSTPAPKAGVQPRAAPAPFVAKPPVRQGPPVPLASPGAEIVAAMHDRYAGTWFHTVAMMRVRTLMIDSTAATDTLYVTAAPPGRMRIDLGDPSNGEGTLFRGDSIYTVVGNLVTHAAAHVDPVDVLAFDVYAQAAPRTDTVLIDNGFDLTKMHQDTWNGRPVMVVGAALGDTLSTQFWVDREFMLVSRVITTAAQGVVDARLSNYQAAGGGWVAGDVRSLLNGSAYLNDVASKIQVNLAVDSSAFDPLSWKTAPRWYRPPR